MRDMASGAFGTVVVFFGVIWAAAWSPCSPAFSVPTESANLSIPSTSAFLASLPGFGRQIGVWMILSRNWYPLMPA